MSAIKITAQRLRNITTGVIHTTREEMIKDIKALTRQTKIEDAYIELVAIAMYPWLKEKVPPSAMLINQDNNPHSCGINLDPMSDEETLEMVRFYIRILASTKSSRIHKCYNPFISTILGQND